MLVKDPFKKGTPRVEADYKVSGEEYISIEGIKIKFRHFPGHTPGNSIIEIDDIWFSGDFLFKDSIGRWDFPYSSSKEMVESLKKVLKIKKNYKLLPGHNESSTLANEQKNIPLWIDYVEKHPY